MTTTKKPTKSSAKENLKPTTKVVKKSVKTITSKKFEGEAAELKDSTSTIESSPAAKIKKLAKQSKPDSNRFYATGRRKEATSRLWLTPGSGRIIVNGRDIEQYFARPVLRMIINQPFAATNSVGLFDVKCTVAGSGLSGQAGAIRHAISRALNLASSEYHPVLRKDGFLTRDSRKVERKKPGRKKARRSFQFSKR